MYDKSIFVFGSKIFAAEAKKDAISTLPLEMAWKIFSYLDDESLRIAYHTHKTWSRIIYSNKNLRKRLNIFELTLKLGSKELARLYKRSRRKMKKTKKNYANYALRAAFTESPRNEISSGCKRQGETLNIHLKRQRLF